MAHYINGILSFPSGCLNWYFFFFMVVVFVCFSSLNCFFKFWHLSIPKTILPFQCEEKFIVPTSFPQPELCIQTYCEQKGQSEDFHQKCPHLQHLLQHLQVESPMDTPCPCPCPRSILWLFSTHLPPVLTDLVFGSLSAYGFRMASGHLFLSGLPTASFWAGNVLMAQNPCLSADWRSQRPDHSPSNHSGWSLDGQVHFWAAGQGEPSSSAPLAAAHQGRWQREEKCKYIIITAPSMRPSGRCNLWHWFLALEKGNIARLCSLAASSKGFPLFSE